MIQKKVLFILHTPPPIHGSSMVGQYIKDSEIINQTFNCQYINLGTSRTIDEIGKNPLIKIWRYFNILWQVLIQLIKFKPSLCYFAITVKGIGFYKDALVALLVKLFGVKLVYHFHNKGVSIRQHKRFDNLLYLNVFKSAEVILLSKHLYVDVSKYLPLQQVHHCPNGIPEIVQSSKFKVQRLKKNDKTVNILFLSNLIESKGVYVLLEACKLLQQKGLQFHCTFVGGEGNITSMQFLQKLEELNISQDVIYAGKKYGTEKEEAFLTSDIFVHPTFDDCFPLVLLEAMQHCLPIVSTFEGGIRDIVEDGKTGFLVPQKDAVALSEKLELLIKNPELRQQMGIAGRKKYEEQFMLNIFESSLCSILSNISS